MVSGASECQPRALLGQRGEVSKAHQIVEEALAGAWEVLGIDKLIGALGKVFGLVEGNRGRTHSSCIDAEIEVQSGTRDTRGWSSASEDTCPRIREGGESKPLEDIRDMRSRSGDSQVELLGGSRF